MKFLCIGCDEQMGFTERRQPGDGTFAAAFACPRCGHVVALLANPMETQLVGALGVRIGGSALDADETPPMALTRAAVETARESFVDARPPAPRPAWSPEALERLARVPGFVRGMVKRIYGDWAADRGIALVTPDVMDRARTELGLEGM
jgi:hypothetical protein